MAAVSGFYILFFMNHMFFWISVGSYETYQHDDKRIIEDRKFAEKSVEAILSMDLEAVSDNIKTSNDGNKYKKWKRNIVDSSRIGMDESNNQIADRINLVDDTDDANNFANTNVIYDKSISTGTNTILNNANYGYADNINRYSYRRRTYGNSRDDQASTSNFGSVNANDFGKVKASKNVAGARSSSTKNKNTNSNANISSNMVKKGNRNKLKSNQKNIVSTKKESSTKNSRANNSEDSNIGSNFDNTGNDIEDATSNNDNIKAASDNTKDDISNGKIQGSSTSDKIVSSNNNINDGSRIDNTNESDNATAISNNINTNTANGIDNISGSRNDNTKFINGIDNNGLESSIGNNNADSSSNNSNDLMNSDNVGIGSNSIQSNSNSEGNNVINQGSSDDFIETVTANTMDSIFDNRTYVVSEEDLNFFKGLFREVLWKYKRNLFYGDFRRVVRKEVRVLTRYEWRRFLKAVKSLKQKGYYDKLAAIHRGLRRMDKAHFGPSFPGWHRLYLLVWEHALQKEYPGVSIPYWDCTIDYDIEDPTISIVWSDRFFGGGKGIVIDGPFANWKTGFGDQLFREIGSRGSLISKDFMQKVLSKQSHQVIMLSNLDNETLNLNYSFEAYHDSVHRWIGGHMQLLDEACEDPIFLIYHSFVDYFWQLYRYKVKAIWGKNPFQDYPDVDGDHHKDNLMDPFGIKNEFGYLDMWYDGFYKYQLAPACNKYYPHCGSRYLYCDEQKDKCLTKTTKYYRKQRNISKRSTSLPKKFKTPQGRTYKAYFVDSRTFNTSNEIQL